MRYVFTARSQLIDKKSLFDAFTALTFLDFMYLLIFFHDPSNVLMCYDRFYYPRLTSEQLFIIIELYCYIHVA